MNLQKPPIGLLELLRLKVGGKQPTFFSETVVPVVEVTPFYAANALITTNGAPTVGGLANLSETLVLSAPLLVHGLSGELTMGAAGGTNVYLGWWAQLPETGPRVYFGSFFAAATVAGQRVGVGSMFNPIQFPAGSLFGVVATGTAAGVDHSLQISLLAYNTTAP